MLTASVGRDHQLGELVQIGFGPRCRLADPSLGNEAVKRTTPNVAVCEGGALVCIYDTTDRGMLLSYGGRGRKDRQCYRRRARTVPPPRSIGRV